MDQKLFLILSISVIGCYSVPLESQAMLLAAERYAEAYPDSLHKPLTSIKETSDSVRDATIGKDSTSGLEGYADNLSKPGDYLSKPIKAVQEGIDSAKKSVPVDEFGKQIDQHSALPEKIISESVAALQDASESLKGILGGQKSSSHGDTDAKPSSYQKEAENPKEEQDKHTLYDKTESPQVLTESEDKPEDHKTKRETGDEVPAQSGQAEAAESNPAVSPFDRSRSIMELIQRILKTVLSMLSGSWDRSHNIFERIFGFFGLA